MNQIKVKLKPPKEDSYPIFFERDSSERIVKSLKKEFFGRTCVIITDDIVRKLYGEKLRARIKKAGHKVFLFSIPHGERSKNQKYKTVLEEKMLQSGIQRQSVIVALGGGVVGDLAGFIAATYMRGVPYTQIPTTLLGMVDSSIGGKTGIDTPQGKNLIGAFWQPKAVFIDSNYLKTLSNEHFVNGLVEAVKMFITSDAKSFEFVEKNIDRLMKRDTEVLEIVIRNAVGIKAGVVERDEKEKGERMILNFGHTIGHALEAVSDYKMLHGYAVGLGIMAEAALSQNEGVLGESDLLRIKKILSDKMGIDLKYLHSSKAKKIIEMTKIDKKTKNGKPQFVMLEKIGKVYVDKNMFAHHIDDRAVTRVLERSGQLAKN